MISMTGTILGSFFALSECSDEFIVGNEDGAVAARSVRRLPEGPRRDVRLLNNLRCFLWMPNPRDSSQVEVKLSIEADPVVKAADIPRIEIKDRVEEVPRQVYIRPDVELKNYWYTHNCPGCKAAREGMAARAHS